MTHRAPSRQCRCGKTALQGCPICAQSRGQASQPGSQLQLACRICNQGLCQKTPDAAQHSTSVPLGSGAEAPELEPHCSALRHSVLLHHPADKMQSHGSSSSASAPPCRRDPESGRAKLQDYLGIWTPVEPLPAHLPQRGVDLPSLALDPQSLVAMEPEVAAGIMLQRLQVSPA